MSEHMSDRRLACRWAIVAAVYFLAFVVFEDGGSGFWFSMLGLLFVGMAVDVFALLYRKSESERS